MQETILRTKNMAKTVETTLVDTRTGAQRDSLKTIVFFPPYHHYRVILISPRKKGLAFFGGNELFFVLNFVPVCNYEYGDPKQKLLSRRDGQTLHESTP